MVLVDVFVANEADDWQVKHVTGGEFTAEYGLSNATWQYNRYGTPQTDFTGSNVFYLFRGITIPQGSTIDNATLIIPQIEVNGVTPMPLTIRAVNNSAPTNQADYQAQTGTGPAFYTPVLTPVVTFSPTDSVATDFPLDVKAHVQALVNAFDYNNDNMLFRMAKKPVTTTQAFDMQNFEYQVNPPDSIANLTINYSGGCTSDFCEDFNEYALSKLPTSRDNFNYSNQTIADLAWVSTDTTKMRVDPVNEKIEIDAFMDGTDDHITFDLGAGISDTWTLRGRITFVSDPGVGTAGSGIYFGLSANKDDNSATSQDNAYMGYLHASSIKQWGVEWGASTNLPTDYFSVPIVETLPLGTELYWELKREGNVLTGQIFNNADFTDSRGKPIRSDFNGSVGFPKNLRYLKFFNRFVVSVTNRVTWEADDIEFWDKGQQGDITFQDDFVQKAVTFSDNFAGADVWADAGTAFGVNMTTEVIDWNVNDTSINHATAFDLGVNGINDTSWVLRAKVTVNNATVGASADTNRLYLGLFDSNETVDSNTTQDGLFIGFLLSTTANQIGLFHRDGAVLDGLADTSFTTAITATTFFVEVKRISATSVAISLFSDSTYTTLIETQIATIPSTISSLRFIKAQNRSTLTGDSTLDGTIDDVEFYNGTSTLTDWLGATGNDVRLDTANEIINFDPPTGVARDELVAFDLQTILDGNNADDEHWTLRFKINTDTLVQGSSEESSSLLVGLDNNLDSTTTGTHNLILFRTTMDQGGAGPQFGAISSSLFREGGEYFTGGTGGATQFPFAWSTGTLFVELKRLSPTLMETTLFTDASFREIEKNSSGVPLTVQDTITSTIIDLRYIRVTTESSAVANDTSYDGSIDDIEFYNGVSVPRTPIEEVKDFEDTFVEDNWVDAGSGVAVNTSTQVIDWNSAIDNVNNTTTFDLGVGNVSDTEWALRFKFTTASLSAGSSVGKYFWIGLFDSDGTVDSETTQDALAFYFLVNSGNPNGSYQLAERDGVILSNTGTNAILTQTATASDIFFIEVKRLSSIRARLSFFSDPDYQQLVESTELTIPAGIVNLRYIALKGRNITATTGGMTGTIDDIEFWNKQSALDHQNKWRKVDE